MTKKLSSDEKSSDNDAHSKDKANAVVEQGFADEIDFSDREYSDSDSDDEKDFISEKHSADRKALDEEIRRTEEEFNTGKMTMPQTKKSWLGSMFNPLGWIRGAMNSIPVTLSACTGLSFWLSGGADILANTISASGTSFEIAASKLMLIALTTGAAQLTFNSEKARALQKTAVIKGFSFAVRKATKLMTHNKPEKEKADIRKYMSPEEEKMSKSCEKMASSLVDGDFIEFGIGMMIEFAMMSNNMPKLLVEDKDSKETKLPVDSVDEGSSDDERSELNLSELLDKKGAPISFIAKRVEAITQAVISAVKPQDDVIQEVDEPKKRTKANHV